VVSDEQLVSDEEHEALMDGAASVAVDYVGPILGHRGSASGEAPEVRYYDFRRPDRFTREQLRILTDLHDDLAVRMSEAIGGYIRAAIGLSLSELVQASYEDFVDVTTEGYFVYSVSLDPFPRTSIIAISADVAFAAIDRMQGGAGKKLKDSRPATDMERELLQKYLIPLVLESVKGAWGEVEAITPRVVASDTSSAYLRIALPADACLTAEFAMKLGNAEGVIRVCYPFALVEPALAIIAANNTPPSAMVVRGPADDANVRRGLGNIQVPVVIELGGAHVSIGDVLGLQVGDVVPLGSRVDGDISVLVSGSRKYTGRPGLRGKRLAVRVTGFAASDDDDEAPPTA
jgi:flagellar motor switch protein FliM